MGLRLYIDRRIGKSNTTTDVRGDVIAAHLMEAPLPAEDGDPASGSTRNARNGFLIVENWRDDALEGYLRSNRLDRIEYPYEVIEALAGDQELRRRRSERRLLLSSLPSLLQTQFVQRTKMPIVDASTVTVSTVARPSPARGGTVEGRDDQRQQQPNARRSAGRTSRRRTKPDAIASLKNIRQQIATAGDPLRRKRLKGAIAYTALRGALRRRISIPAANLEIELLDITPAATGLAVYVRGWRDGQQLGFGPDGSVEIEKITIVNPPVAVRDATGNSAVSPRRAALQAIGQTVDQIGKDGRNIIEGKIGRSTYTIYSDASGDGSLLSSDASWATARSAADSADNSTTLEACSATLSGTYQIKRILLPFDTSSIPSGDTIDSAVLALNMGADNDTDTTGIGILYGNQSAVDSLGTGDWAPSSFTEIATRLPLASATTGYNNFTLTDTSGIAKGSGFTSLMTAIGRDIDNSAPTGTNQIVFYTADQTGTSNDPRLTVETSGAADVTIKPAGGGDYLDFATAEADLGAGARTWTVYEGGDCGGVTLNDSDPSSLLIEAAPLNQHDGSSGGAFTSGNIGVQVTFGARGDLTIQGLRHTSVSPFAATSIDGLDVTFEQALFTTGELNCLCLGAVSFAVTAINSIFLAGVQGTFTNGTVGFTLQNCTVRRNTTIGALRITRSGGTPTILLENVYAHNLGSGAAFENASGTAGTFTCNNCASHDDTADDFSGSNNLINKSAASCFVDAANDDYRLKAGGPLADAGKTIGAITDDIIGTARPVGAAYDIGAFEGVVGSAARLIARSIPRSAARSIASTLTNITD